ncbi:MAG TPA: hypothetical protein PKH43_04615, partial [Saprospiraceae bacterium]|nr:hypothetical protein [Saprospiraceae bacterium]
FLFLRPTYPARSNTLFPKTQAGAGLCWLALGLAQCHGSRHRVKFCFLFLRPTYPARSNTLFPKTQAGAGLCWLALGFAGWHWAKPSATVPARASNSVSCS